MEKSTNCKSVFSLEEVFQASKSIAIHSTKTVTIDTNTLQKIKNILTDYPEYDMSMAKLLNAIITKWLEEHREELMQHHMSKSINRY